MSGFDVQNSINTAAAAKCVEAAESHFYAQFKNACKNSFVVSSLMTPEQENLLRVIANVPFVCEKNARPVTNDHPVLVGCRELIRQDYEHQFRVSGLKSRTLVVGSSARELFTYKDKDNFDFYFHFSEGKDIGRTVIPVVEEVISLINDKVRNNKKLRDFFSRKNQEQNSLGSEDHRLYGFYNNFSELLKHYQKLADRPDVCHVNYSRLNNCNVLLFEDSFYNFDEVAVMRIFEQTNATVAYGYLMLPLEFWFGKRVFNPLFTVKTVGDEIKMAYRGFNNGYVHKAKAWRLLADRMGISTPSYNLLFQLSSRIGPFVTFQIEKTHAVLNEHRIIALPDNQRIIKILNIVESSALEPLGVKKFDYFPVLASEFYAAHQYFFVLKEKSLDIENLGSFVRHRMTGASLVNRELLPAWQLDTAYFVSFCAALHIYTVRKRSVVNELIAAYTSKTLDAFWIILRNYIHGFLKNTTVIGSFLFNIVFPNNLDDILVLYPDNEIEQNFSAPAVGKFRYKGHLMLDGKDPANDCPFCAKMKDKLGAQKVSCEYKSHKTKLVFTQEDVDFLREKYLKDSNDSFVDAGEKSDHRSFVPVTPFTYECEIQFINGAYGTGKTDYACHLFDPINTVATGPFKLLLTDYENFVTRDGVKKQFQYKTVQYKALEFGNYKVLLVDEVTAVPYEDLMAVVKRVQPSILVFIGDPKQCIVDRKFGTSILDRIDFSLLSTHTLHVNFRNARDVVALLNKHYGYSLEAYRQDYHSLRVVHKDDFHEDKAAVRMFFSERAKNDYGDTQVDQCVPSHQGRTYQKGDDNRPVYLFATQYDGPAIRAMRAVRVGLSRHKRALTLVHDGSTQAQVIVRRIQEFGDKETIDEAIPVVEDQKTQGGDVFKQDVETLLHRCPAVNALKDAVDTKKQSRKATLGEYHDSLITSCTECVEHKSVETRKDWIDCVGGHGFHPKTPGARECHLCIAYGKMPVESDGTSRVPVVEDQDETIEHRKDFVHDIRASVLERFSEFRKTTPWFARVLDLIDSLVALVEDPYYRKFRTWLISAVRTTFELFLAYKTYRFFVKQLTRVSVLRILLREALSGFRGFLSECFSELYRIVNPALAGHSPTGNYSLDHWLVYGASLLLPKFCDILIAIWNLVDIPRSFTMTHLSSIFSYYIPNRINPFSTDKARQARDLSNRNLEKGIVTPTSEHDLSYTSGYCWLNGFDEKYHRVLSLVFPYGMPSSLLGVVYGFGSLLGITRADIDLQPGHLARSNIVKSRLKLTYNMLCGKPYVWYTTEVSGVTHTVYRDDSYDIFSFVRPLVTGRCVDILDNILSVPDIARLMQLRTAHRVRAITQLPDITTFLKEPVAQPSWNPISRAYAVWKSKPFCVYRERIAPTFSDIDSTMLFQAPTDVLPEPVHEITRVCRPMSIVYELERDSAIMDFLSSLPVVTAGAFPASVTYAFALRIFGDEFHFWFSSDSVTVKTTQAGFLDNTFWVDTEDDGLLVHRLKFSSPAFLGVFGKMMSVAYSVFLAEFLGFH